MTADLIIFSAGSFRAALNQLAKVFSQQYAQQADRIQLEFAPAGLLRERLEQHEACDIFISADLQNIQRLITIRPPLATQCLAQNRLMITHFNQLPFIGKTAMELLLNPEFTIGTSTPICDPSGDYTWQLFDLIEQHYPNQGNLLKQRAKQLVGGKTTTPIPADELASGYLLKQKQADLFIGYAHYANAIVTQGLAVTYFEPPFDLIANYGCALLSPHPLAQAFYQFLFTDSAQAIIRQHGFL